MSEDWKERMKATLDQLDEKDGNYLARATALNDKLTKAMGEFNEAFGDRHMMAMVMGHAPFTGDEISVRIMRSMETLVDVDFPVRGPEKDVPEILNEIADAVNRAVKK